MKGRIRPKKILARYALDYDTIKPFNHEKRNKVWVLYKKNKPVFLLKRMNKSKTLFPIMLQERLSKLRLSPQILLTKNRKLFSNDGKWMFYVSVFKRNLKPLSVEQRIRAISRFHTKARFAKLKKFKMRVIRTNRQTFLQEYKNKMNDLKTWRKKCSSKSLKAWISSMERLATASYQQVITCDIDKYLKTIAKRNQIVHGDFNANNAFATKGGEVILLDFELSFFGPPLYDFRFILNSMIRAENDTRYVEKRKKI